MGKKVMFFGTDYIAVKALSALFDAKNIVKSLKLIAPHSQPQKQLSTIDFATKNNIDFIKLPPKTKFDLSNFYLPKHGYDIGVVVSFGYLIPKDIINSFKYGMINLHPSLLPKYRGASPIQNTILNNEAETGVSIIQISPQIDCGSLLYQQKTKIHQNETFWPLYRRLSEKGAQLILKAVENAENFNKIAKPQKNVNPQQIEPKEEENFYKKSYSKFSKRSGHISFVDSDRKSVYNKWRAFYEYLPVVAFYKFAKKRKRFQIFKAFLPENKFRLAKDFDKMNEKIRLKSGHLSAGKAIFLNKKDSRLAGGCLLVKCKCGKMMGIENMKTNVNVIRADDFINGFSDNRSEIDFYFFNFFRGFFEDFFRLLSIPSFFSIC
ncbi:hypothetical protein MHBO_003052 [Bonamia ostreae]|uniref:methionyl-tRNA formyltransferase n=1 Tax=Bonamia ostreae TaxID=126728 RepID=A0ABV2APC9_9EUKA